MMRSNVLEDFLHKVRSSEHKQTDDSFSDSYALLRVMFDQSSSLMGLLKPDGTILKINSKAKSFLTVNEREVIGKPMWDTPWWTHSPEQQRLVRHAVRAAARGRFVRFEATHPT